jgi:hypothetical protein
VRIVADRAALSEGFVLENKGTGLLAMTVCTGFVQARHGQAASTLEDIRAMRVVTLHTIHPLFDHWMMLRQFKFGVGLEMALETSRRVLPGIDDELADSSTCRDVFASRTMTRLAPGQARHFRGVNVNASVGAGRETSRNVRMAIEANLVADVSGAGDFRRRHDRAFHRRTGDEERQSDCDARYANKRRSVQPG